MSDQAFNKWESLEDTVAKDVFKSEVEQWRKKIGVDPKEVHVRAMKRKWGSCSTAGRVTFDTALLTQPATFRRKVIVHELLHLKVPNHGRVFRALLRAYLGEAAELIDGDLTAKSADITQTNGSPLAMQEGIGGRRTKRG
jgi:predicted metal-dependent hydrolase